MRHLTDREFAERMFRQEHSPLHPFSPYQQRPELNDLWEADQQAYVERCARIRRAALTESTEP